MAAFYKDMERKEIVERKLSKKSNAGTSIWARKSVKRSGTAHPVSPPAHDSHQPRQGTVHNDEQRREEEERVTVNHDDSDKPDWVRPMNSPRSIIPDAKDLPASSKDAWDSVPVPSHKMRYFIHNPVGPRWYKNHHLIPRSETTPAARPPSFFSPSFPPIKSASQDRLDDPTRLAGPSRTPSNSPLPTPNSSQTRVEDRPRARKTSETAHDVVDLWDVTDPWGTNWHHHSPYDIGLVNGPISADVHDILQTRSRRSSVGQSQGRTVAPSPLSQSTPAINLQVKPDIQVPRKLSKRRAPTAASVFSVPQDTGRHGASLPTTPMETNPSPFGLPKRMSVAAPPNGSSISTRSLSPKKEKRGSILGRLVKKFSLLTKPASDSNKEDDWQHISSHTPVVETAPQQSFVPSRQAFVEKRLSEAPKRVPPPSIASPPPVEGPVKVDDTPVKEADSCSITSVEAPFSIGRLTIANPDAPASGETTPAQGDVPLPPSKEPIRRMSHREVTTPPIPQLDRNPPMPPEKSSSPPAPAAKSNQSVISELPPTSPITIRQSIVEQHPEHSPEVSSSPKHPPSIISHTSQASFGDSELPSMSTEKPAASSSHPPASSARKTPKPVDRPPSQTLHPPPPASHKPRVDSIASSVPFPGGDAGDTPQPYYEYDNSPLSAASILANPPTPYTDGNAATLATPDQPPPLPLKISTDLPARQTETFRLVRSPSGNVYASNEKILAGGEQWEVIGSEKQKKGSSSSKELTPKESESRPHESKDRRPKDRDTKERDTKEKDTKERDTKEKDTKEKDTKERDTKGRDTKGRDTKDPDLRDRDHRRSTKEDYPRESKDRDVRDARDKDHVRHSRDRDYARDSRDQNYARDSKDRDHARDSRAKEHARESRDKDYTRESRDRDYARESRDKDYTRESRDRDYARESRDKEYARESRDRDYARESRDREYAREPRDRDRVRHSRDRDYPREYRDRERDSKAHDHKVRDDRDHKNHESSHRADKKRESKVHADYQPEPEKDSRHRHRSHRESKSGAVERATTVSKAMSRAFEADTRNHEPILPSVQHESKRSDRPREDRERKLTRKRHETSPTTTNPSKAQPAPPPPTQDVPTSRPLGRHPSLSARPTSQLPSADEINALRAKEAWDMERLWKARSMEGDEFNRYSTMPTIPSISSNHNTPLMGSLSPPGPPSLYGTSHTAFVVKTPFQTQHSIYHSMPAAPPPIVYASPPHIPAVVHQLPHNHRPPRTRIYADSVSSDQKSYMSALTHNPLPELPRESPYEIPADARNSEYWTKYAGLATSH
ncbi:hypothetical protein C0991_009164 [Blastosporella zonata]|nr:hypothetical protein C0991_009164 [Blastosporella zonata]